MTRVFMRRVGILLVLVVVRAIRVMIVSMMILMVVGMMLMSIVFHQELPIPLTRVNQALERILLLHR